MRFGGADWLGRGDGVKDRGPQLLISAGSLRLLAGMVQLRLEDLIASALPRALPCAHPRARAVRGALVRARARTRMPSRDPARPCVILLAALPGPPMFSHNHNRPGRLGLRHRGPQALDVDGLGRQQFLYTEAHAGPTRRVGGVLSARIRIPLRSLVCRGYYGMGHMGSDRGAEGAPGTHRSLRIILRSNL